MLLFQLVAYFLLVSAQPPPTNNLGSTPSFFDGPIHSFIALVEQGNDIFSEEFLRKYTLTESYLQQDDTVTYEATDSNASPIKIKFRPELITQMVDGMWIDSGVQYIVELQHIFCYIVYKDEISWHDDIFDALESSPQVNFDDDIDDAVDEEELSSEDGDEDNEIEEKDEVLEAMPVLKLSESVVWPSRRKIRHMYPLEAEEIKGKAFMLSDDEHGIDSELVDGWNINIINDV